MTMAFEWTHPQLAGQLHCPLVTMLRRFCLGRLPSRRDIAKEFQGPCFIASFFRFLGEGSGASRALFCLIDLPGQQPCLAVPAHSKGPSGFPSDEIGLLFRIFEVAKRFLSPSEKGVGATQVSVDMSHQHLDF